MKTKFVSMLIVIVSVLLASSAMASIVIDFGVVTGSGANGGSIHYLLGDPGLIGENIEVDEVSVVPGGPSFNLLSAFGANAFLNFQTGPLASFDPVEKKWDFNGGGSIVISLDIPSDGQGPITLLSGEWQSAEVMENAIGPVTLDLVVGDFTDEKNLCMLWYLELISEEPIGNNTLVGDFEGFLHLSFTVDSMGEYFESVDILSGDLDNVYVPIPGAIWMLGSGILSLIFTRRKIKN
jgi:hypothetical protein